MIKLIKLLTKHITYNRDKFINASQWHHARQAEILTESVNNHWTCKYNGSTIINSSAVDIDHIVPLKYAWLHGADTWTDVKRHSLATDPLNLTITCEHENRSKGDKGLLEYLPHINKDFYVDHWDKVCVKYDIDLSEKEMEIIAKYKKSINSTIL